jgi:ribosomal protein S18 acetylase RimI-like enzyme
MINIIKTKELADKCDQLLTKLIRDEKQYDDSIDNEFEVKNFYSNTINDDEKTLFGYFVNDELVGYLYLIEIVSNNNKGFKIDALYMEEEYRNHGYAKELINEAIMFAEGNEGKFIDINVMNSNIIAKNLYEGLGFNPLRVEMRRNINT